MNISQLKRKIKPPLPKKIKKLLVAFLGSVVTLGLLVTFIFNLYSQNWGLHGDFYKGINFEKKISSGFAKTINFSDCVAQMDKNLPDYFSARYSGFLRAPKNGIYNFSFVLDRSARLFIDRKLIIDVWSNQVTLTKNILLTEGFHSIWVEYAQQPGTYGLKLFWTPPGGKKEIIPAYYLRHKLEMADLNYR